MCWIKQWNCYETTIRSGWNSVIEITINDNQSIILHLWLLKRKREDSNNPIRWTESNAWLTIENSIAVRLNVNRFFRCKTQRKRWPDREHQIGNWVMPSVSPFLVPLGSLLPKSSPPPLQLLAAVRFVGLNMKYNKIWHRSGAWALIARRAAPIRSTFPRGSSTPRWSHDACRLGEICF